MLANTLNSTYYTIATTDVQKNGFYRIIISYVEFNGEIIAVQDSPCWISEIKLWKNSSKGRQHSGPWPKL